MMHILFTVALIATTLLLFSASVAECRRASTASSSSADGLFFNPITNYRIAPALGNRSGQYVRITAITPVNESHSAAFESFFSYKSPFKYRWTGNKVYTTLHQITADGSQHNLNIGGQGELVLNITVPPLGRGVRGIVMADPCVVSKFAHCETAHKEHLARRLPELLNAAMLDPSMSFACQIGDLYYDGDGSITPSFVSKLSSTFKNKQLLTAPGNYDAWTLGNPAHIEPSTDSFFNGYMQTYGMDALASKADPFHAPFNFSVNPNNGPYKHHHDYLAEASNLQFYTQIGNLGFISFSGAHHRHLDHAFLAEACQYFDEHKHLVDKIFVMGHWVRDTNGCASNKTSTPSIYEYILEKHSHQGCPHHKLKWFAGHEHCNEVITPKKGFLVGGFGKDDSHCRNFGLPFVDSTGGKLLVAYFPILHNDESLLIDKMLKRKDRSSSFSLVSASWSFADEQELQRVIKSPTDRFDALVACAKQPGGLSQCVSNGNIEVEIWLDESIH